MYAPPPPEYMEAYGRLLAMKRRLSRDMIREEMDRMRRTGDTVRAGIADIQEQHRAVFAKYSALYTEPERAWILRH